MAVTGVKYDHGTNAYAINCFPVRGILRQREDGSGAWKVAYRAEEFRRFKAYLTNKPSSHKTKYSQVGSVSEKQEEGEEDSEILDGFFLLRHCCVYDPSDICSVNIFGCGFTNAHPDDFEFFDNIVYVNAGDNLLPLETFKYFPQLMELEVQSCQIADINLFADDFPNLVMLDLSYNKVKPRCLCYLALLVNLRVLHLTDNELSEIPDFSEFIAPEDKFLFPSLEVLMLDSNELTSQNTFTRLGAFKSLQHLNLEHNSLSWIPNLKVIDGKVLEVSVAALVDSGLESKTYYGNAPNGITPARVPIELEYTEDEPMIKFSSMFDNLDETQLKPKDNLQTPVMYLQSPSNESLKLDLVDVSHLKSEILEAKLQDKQMSEILKENFKGAENMPKRTTVNDDMPAPFCCLRFINLAHNKFEKEESLLASALWPSLVDIDIHGNPLVTLHSGKPQLLKEFLGDRLGITLYRDPPAPVTKQPLKMQSKKLRKVSGYIPRVTKLSLEERMHPPLPSISSVAEKSFPSRLTHEDACSLPEDTVVNNRSTDDHDNLDKQNNALETDSFFVTEGKYYDEVRQEMWNKTSKDSMVLKNDKVENDGGNVVDQRYRGYEELLSQDNVAKSDERLPSDILGNVRSLRYALSHSLTYRDLAVDLTTIQPTHPPQPSKLVQIPMVHHRRKQEKVEDILNDLRERDTYTDAPLLEVLHGDDDEKSFSEAVKLLRTIEQRYNLVLENASQSGLDVKGIVNESSRNIATANKSS